ncbi:MAG: hypothetical protein R3300_20930 [Candidatus Promineifilaceae bacterium]|nr:hypothetical protein [Candidatus Promineifilaceae bacterium]
MKGWIWSGKPWQAFKNFAILFSFAVNLVLLLAILLAGPLLLPALNQVALPLVGGLNQSFVEMGEARIVRTVAVEDTIPIQFELPVSTTTTAEIVEPVPMSVPTSFVLPGGGGTINGTVFFDLPAGTQLPVSMELVVPVDQQVPVELAVDVEIPMQETELGRPFGQLQRLFAPLERFLRGLPADNGELGRRLLVAPAGAATVEDGRPADGQAGLR